MKCPILLLLGTLSLYFCHYWDLQYWLSTRLQFQPFQNCEGCHTRGSKSSSPGNSILAQALRDLGEELILQAQGQEGLIRNGLSSVGHLDDYILDCKGLFVI